MELIGKVVGINRSDKKYNLTVEGISGTYNIKLEDEQKDLVETGFIYMFEVEMHDGVRISYHATSIKLVDKLSLDIKDEVLRHYLESSPLNKDESIKIIDNYINKIDNKILKDITRNIIDKYKDNYYTYPAATKMHHAYIGGLVYHVIGMLKMADAYIETYPFIDKNYLYAGIILHDIGKTKEFTGEQNTQYSLEGQLLGHISIGMIDIAIEASILGYSNTKELLYLEHMILSHHGQPLYGSPKKPMFAEAIALSFIDNTDSKLRVLGEELEKTEVDNYTETIGVLDRIKAYKI